MGTGLGTALGLGIDLVVVTVLYYWYKRSNKSADEIKNLNSKHLKIDETLEGTVRCAEDSCIPYACIVGEVTPVGSTLRSSKVAGLNGVIQHIRLEEHKSEKVEGLWSDAVKVIQDKVQSVPFTLQRVFANGTYTVLVVDPESANYIIDDLTLTHDAIEPDAAVGFVSRILDRLLGYVVYHKSERMLLNNTTLLAIGELRYVDGKIQIATPRSGSKYILTKKLLPEIIKLAEKKSFRIKVLLIGTATVGVALLGKLMYDFYRRRREDDIRRNYEEMRRL